MEQDIQKGRDIVSTVTSEDLLFTIRTIVILLRLVNVLQDMGFL